MQSFRTEIENPVVEKDIIELEKKIRLFRVGNIDEDRFRSLRLARGVYGQRQQGVQMVRIKIPFGRLTVPQIRRVADIADEYANSNIHLTTRQDIQIHFVSLDRTPELWSELEQDKLTLREACGNTVRNVTASAKAGIDPNEPFDVSPYAQSIFEYFLRNPVCQEMGRKFKIALSSSQEDSAFTFIHDIGLIPKVKEVDGKEIRGFKVLIGGGLGAQPHMAEVASEFMEEDKVIPFTESVLRVFDRHGERNKRGRARMKFLMKSIGAEELIRLAGEEQKSLRAQSVKVDRDLIPEQVLPKNNDFGPATISDERKYALWKTTNVFPQKQEGYYGVHIKLPLGNILSDKARKFADIVEKYAADDVRITVNQGFLLKFLTEDALPHLFNALHEIDLAEPGFDSTADVTACPGTDTCNLGISNSTGASNRIEQLIRAEYPELVKNNDIKIKISGCPNSCGQHGIASIGFHGSSMKDKNKNVLPALQVLLGGGVDGNGEGRIAEKITKVPSKKVDETMRVLLDDYEENGNDGEYYADYYLRQGKMYFYHLLKPLTDLESLSPEDYKDWKHEHEEEAFKVEAGVGECAGVVIDLIQTLIVEAEEKLESALENYQGGNYADAIYNAYSGFVIGAKSLLLSDDKNPNNQMNIIKEFDKHYVESGKVNLDSSFEALVLQIRDYEPTEAFAKNYIAASESFLTLVKKLREQQLNSKVHA
ncbi:sulfite reductase (ferredoxin) [Catalinimonas alkaloidigena]|uniref:nitrite reductase n=1 Tax=Catalinimonas alkaloidigena TaxID=1075417 RepID=UPI002404FE25|nr:nitrite reductase [Catalinimonas alkaloidigena]MDF9796696.1 sulfite reductase (ferredoxin) [Catalinimonas alkaloidigena]